MIVCKKQNLLIYFKLLPRLILHQQFQAFDFFLNVCYDFCMSPCDH